MKKVLSMLSTAVSALRQGARVRLVCAALLLCAALPLAALERVISPVAGVWANKQSLVLNVRDGAECFYSYSGTDPLTSGFMYDGPVLIDASGDVTVRVVCVLGGSREEYQISYTVDEDGAALFEDGSIEQHFIESVASHPLYPVATEQPFTIPQSFSFCFGDGAQPFIPGMALTVDAENRLSRYIPCTVVSRAHGADKKWRFVVFLMGGDAGTLAKQQVPFELRNWTTFVWQDRKQIYTIDGSDWSANTEPLLLDRSVSHSISWQSVAYEKGNPVQTFVLPAKPELEVRVGGDKKGPVVFSIQGDARYRMEIVSSGNGTDAPSSNGLFTQAAFDTFTGDYIGGTAVFALYCDGVYQGEMTAPYVIDNKPPLPPVISATARSGEYARKPVELTIASEDGASLYYAVSGAIPVEADVDMDALSDSVDVGNFHSYEGGIVLASGEHQALFYKVSAYALDSAGNLSATSDYTVVIDEFNYYLSEGASPGGDGSRNRPLGTFAQALDVIGRGRFAHFYVTGRIPLGGGEHAVTSNCAFTSLGEARFVVAADGSIVVRSASLAASGCIFEKECDTARMKKSSGVLFKLESAAVALDGCEIVGVFDENGTAISATGSVIDFVSTGLTVQGDVYACGVSASDSKIIGKGSRFTAIAPTAVNFSVQGGLFELRESDCKVVSHLGRIAELSRTNARITGNSYIGEFDTKTARVSAVWRDEKTLMLENANNTSVGF